MSGSTGMPESMNSIEAVDAIESILDESSVEIDEVEAEASEAPAEAEEVTDEAVEVESEEVAPSEDEEQGSIETLAELAEALDLPLEEVMANLKTTVKVNGEELAVTLKEAFDGYQKDADYRNKTTELAHQRRAFDEQSANARQQLEQQFIQLGQFIQTAEQMFVKPLDPTQMEYLRQTDPQRYLMAKHEHDEQVAQVQRLKQSAAEQFAANQQYLQQQQQAQLAEVFEKASQELHTRIPTWSNDTKTAVDSYLTGDKYGYTPQELAQVIDPRLVEIAHKAMLYDQQASKADVVTKKVKTLPKVQPKAAQNKVNPKLDALTQAKARLRKSGSTQDAVAAVEQLLF
ncbi:MAG: hypothetical protein EP323_00450 [Gammaproteobacteria bacterium]|nr:MAG: hypothetical protein EP323_00450 [Gammaproteobacteria bacterium]